MTVKEGCGSSINAFSKGPTVWGLILSCRNIARWFVRKFSPKRCAEFS